jgi:hypothetical protein
MISIQRLNMDDAMLPIESVFVGGIGGSSITPEQDIEVGQNAIDHLLENRT